MTQTSDNKEFINLIDFLKGQKGISKKRIAKDTGIPYYKINDILNSKSTASHKELTTLKKAYAYILEEGDQANEKDRIELLEAEVKKMKKENIEMKNMLLRLQNELLTKKK